VPGHVLLGVLAVVMLLAAWMMTRGPDVEHAQPHPPRAAWRIILDGFFVGLMIGFVGIGGGFLIVPALVLLGGLPMRMAVGTTLCISALSAGVSFIRHLNDLADIGQTVDWRTITLFIAVGIFGRWLGHRLGDRANHRVLTRWFGYFLVLMAGFILVKEFWPGAK
jgi:uncharacterized membrane protein YfcA